MWRVCADPRCVRVWTVDPPGRQRAIALEFGKRGEAALVVQARKLTEGNVMNHRVGELPVQIQIGS